MAKPAPDATPQEPQCKVLLLALSKRDATITAGILREARFQPVVCGSNEELAGGIDDAAGLAIITAEALGNAAMFRIREVLERQPHWSDMPLLILVPGPDTERAIRSFAPLGDRANITFIDRPVQVRSLLSAVRAAWRTRLRQYETRNLVQRLREEIQERERANRLKDEFLATLAHELRTPMTAVLGWVQLLKMKGNDESSITTAVHMIESSTRVQARLIEDLLDVSRIVTGKLRIDQKPVEMRAVVNEVLDIFTPRVQERGLELQSHLPDEPLTVSGDDTRLHQITWNLLSNAMKFTPRGGHVQVSLAREGSIAVLEVADDGKGIEPDFLPYVFERFRQADNTTTRQQSGLGLGLAIVQHLVHLHGGEVKAASEGVGKGATFIVRIPLLATTDPEND